MTIHIQQLGCNVSEDDSEQRFVVAMNRQYWTSKVDIRPCNDHPCQQLWTLHEQKMGLCGGIPPHLGISARFYRNLQPIFGPRLGQTHPLFGNFPHIIMESRYIGICLIIGKIIDIDIILPKFVGDLKDISANLSVLKMKEDLSKKWSISKKLLIAQPYT